jgi:hypothetical protein
VGAVRKGCPAQQHLWTVSDTSTSTSTSSSATSATATSATSAPSTTATSAAASARAATSAATARAACAAVPRAERDRPPARSRTPADRSAPLSCRRHSPRPLAANRSRDPSVAARRSRPPPRVPRHPRRRSPLARSTGWREFSRHPLSATRARFWAPAGLQTADIACPITQARRLSARFHEEILILISGWGRFYMARLHVAQGVRRGPGARKVGRAHAQASLMGLPRRR